MIKLNLNKELEAKLRALKESINPSKNVTLPKFIETILTIVVDEMEKNKESSE